MGKRRAAIAAVLVLGLLGIGAFALYWHKQALEERIIGRQPGYRIGDDDPEEKPAPATCEDKVRKVQRCTLDEDNDVTRGIMHDLRVLCEQRHEAHPKEHQELLECQVKGACNDLSACQTRYNHAVQ